VKWRFVPRLLRRMVLLERQAIYPFMNFPGISGACH
jgi:hypothetical protein